jgi:hypothetical protein
VKAYLFISQECKGGIEWSKFSVESSQSSENHQILQRRKKATVSVFLSESLGEIGS